MGFYSMSYRVPQVFLAQNINDISQERFPLDVYKCPSE